ncbi:hypothetical protein quinque_014927 [Culex quinquefasciatus]
MMIRGYSELLMLFNIEIRVLIFAWKQAEFEDFLAIVQGVFDKVMISSETYAFCKLGNELTEKSITVGRSVFEAQWSELPVDIQKGLSLMIRRSQKWEGLTAARFCPLGIEQFGAMVQTSYSVFVVLKERLQGVI